MRAVHDVISNALCFPLRVENRRRAICFVPMTADTYRQSVFLDHRIKTAGPEQFSVTIDDVSFYKKMLPRPSQAILIFHGAFCCSTLLARYFESFSFFAPVLKEPEILTQLSLSPKIDTTEWCATADTVYRLLVRPISKDQASVIKAHEPSNRISKFLLRQDASAVAAFVYVSLSEFVLAVLKLDDRRAWARLRAHQEWHRLRRTGLLSTFSLDRVGDAVAAAIMWFANRGYCHSLYANFPNRTVLVEGNDLAERPQETLLKIAGTLQSPFDKHLSGHVAGLSRISSHSKGTNTPFDANTRKVEIEELATLYKDEYDDLLRWLKTDTAKEISMSFGGTELAATFPSWASDFGLQRLTNIQAS